jgi:hypothetical protein
MHTIFHYYLCRQRSSGMEVFMKRFSVVSLLLTFLVLFCFNGIAFAHVDNGNIFDSKPLEGVAPDNGILDEPGGKLTPNERTQIDKKSITDFGISPQHIGYPHIHYFDGIYNRYDGYLDRGEVASGYNGKGSSDTLSFSITKTVSNGWNTNIGFSANTVSSGVGYNVQWSATKSWTYSATVNPYKTVHIGYQDWYHVQEYYCHTMWLYNPPTYTFGDGWAQQWFKPHFYSWQT